MPNDRAKALAIQIRFIGRSQELAQHLISICLNQTNLVKETFYVLDNFSTLDVGYRFVDLIPRGTLLQLAGTREGKGFCELLLSWLRNAALPNNRQPIAPHVDTMIALMKLKTAIDSAPELPAQEEKSGEQISGSSVNIPFASLKAGENIRLSPFVIEKMTKIAADYHETTGKSITITDGNRTPLEQAYMMIRQIKKGKIGLYTQRQAADEVKKAYDASQSEGKSDDQIAQDIAKVIQNQIDTKGIYISRHMKNRGADVRSRDMSADERRIFSQAVVKHGGEPLTEGDHLHLQF